LKRATSNSERGEAEQNCSTAEEVIINEHRERYSQILVDEAHIRTLPLDYVKWERGLFDDQVLTSQSMIRLHAAVEEDRRKTWEFRAKVFGMVVTGLVGLVGALTGLFAILHRR
jgi:hypothetical protein